MPFKMKGSPLRVEGVIKTTAEKESARIASRDAQVAKEIQIISDRKTSARETKTAKRQSQGLYTKAELAAKKTNKPQAPSPTSGSSRGSGSNTTPISGGRGRSRGYNPTPTPTKTPAPSKTPAATSGNKKDYFASTAKALTAYSLKSDNNKGAKGAAVKEFAGTAEFLNAGKDVSFTPGYKPSSKPSKEKAKSTKSADAPKSRKEMKLAKVKNKAATVKSDYNAGSRGQAEGRAAKAKHNRLNKRAERIENRIAKKNKK